MHAKIDKADCMFLMSDEQFHRFYQLHGELECFTSIFPTVKQSYHSSILLLDIWFFISTEEIDRIENPENMMIYPFRRYFLKILKQCQIKRYIQLALYENEKLAFICALHILKALDTFILSKMELNPEADRNIKKLKKISEQSLRPYFSSKAIENESYPRELALLQNDVVTELQLIHQKFENPIMWIFEQAIEQASEIYEEAFGLINDWGGKVP